MSFEQSIHYPPTEIGALLGQTSASTYAYRPFITPLPVWDHWIWLLVPLCVAVALVYKCAKCRTLADVPRESAIISLWILAAMIGAAVLLVGVTWATTPQ